MVCEGALLERHRPACRLPLVPEEGEGVVKRLELGFGKEEAPWRCISWVRRAF